MASGCILDIIAPEDLSSEITWEDLMEEINVSVVIDEKRSLTPTFFFFFLFFAGLGFELSGLRFSLSHSTSPTFL
jgi:hypothetical protein